MAEINEPKNTVIIIYGILLSLGLFGLLVALLVYFNFAVQEQVDVKIGQAPTEALNNLRTQETELLHKYAKIEGAPQLARIDINQAMALEAQAPWRNSIQLSGEGEVALSENANSKTTKATHTTDTVTTAAP